MYNQGESSWMEQLRQLSFNEESPSRIQYRGPPNSTGWYVALAHLYTCINIYITLA